MKRKTLFWAALLCTAAVISGGYYALTAREGSAASVYVDGALYGTYDLGAVVIPYEVRIETERGFNTLRVSHGAIEVAEADCAGQDCVRQGEIRDGRIPIVCLPHRIVIEIEDQP